MTAAPYTLGVVLDHLEHALHNHPGFRWHGATQHCPNGRYVIDYANNVLYLDRRLTGQGAFAAFIDACVELDANAACPPAHTLQRHTARSGGD